MTIKKNPREFGFTLTELLVSLVISSLTITAVLTAYLNITKQNLAQSNFNTVQQNSLVLSKILGDMVQQAGYLGCRSIGQNYQVYYDDKNIEAKFNLNHGRAIEVISYKNIRDHPNIPYKIKNVAHKNSDILWVNTLTRIFKPKSITHKFNINTFTEIKINGRFELNKDEVVVLSSCAQVYFLKAILSGDYNPSKEYTIIKVAYNPLLDKINLDNFQIGKIYSTIFYLADTKRTLQDQTPVLAVYRGELNTRSGEIVEGVSQFKLDFDSDLGQMNAYIEYCTGVGQRMCKKYHHLWQVRVWS